MTFYWKKSSSPFWLCLALAFSTLCSASGQDTIETVDGRSIKGQLAAIDASGAAVGSEFAGLVLDQVLSIQFGASTSLPEVDDGVTVTLIDGGNLVVRNPVIDGESIAFDAIAGMDSISMQSVRSIVLRKLPGLADAVRATSSDDDQIVVESKNGSLAKLGGVLESLGNEKLQLNYQGKSRKIDRRKVAAIMVADLGLAKVSGSLARLTLGGGTSIVGGLREITDSKVSVELTGGQMLHVDREYVARIDIESDGIAWLATLEPIEAIVQPQFTVQRPWQRNRSIGGNPIRLAVANPETTEPTITTFNSGIGTQSFSRLAFANESGFTRFLATVGIDVETEGRGDCVMRVEGDGISLWSARVRGGEPAVEIDVNIKDISQVVLIVEPGEQFDLADHADWAKARFLKSE